MPAHVRQTFAKHPGMLKLPLLPLHGWSSTPDEGGHTHCQCCAATITPGDPVVGCYHEFTSVVFCPACVEDNPDPILHWLSVAGL